MSLRAILWAIDDARIDDIPAGAFRVLLILADHAHEDGTAAYPGVGRLAERTRMTDRSVRRHLVTLQGAGLIAPGDPRHVVHLDPRHRPMVWDLLLHAQAVDNPVGRGDSSVTPTVPGVTGSAPRGDRNGPPGVTPAVHRTVQNQERTAPGGGASTPVDNLHPHHANAARALRALAVPGVQLEDLLAIAYSAGAGDPWRGYLAIKAEATNLDDVRDVPRVLRHRLRLTA